jgi:hypothetical protein
MDGPQKGEFETDLAGTDAWLLRQAAFIDKGRHPSMIEAERAERTVK